MIKFNEYTFIKNLLLHEFRHRDNICRHPHGNNKQKIHKEDIWVHVSVKLEKQKDVQNEKRFKLAEEVGAVVTHNLRQHFTGSKDSAKFHLHVFVVRASDGNRTQRIIAAPLGGNPNIKESLAWILSSREHSSVVMYGREVTSDSAGWGLIDIFDVSCPWLMKSLQKGDRCAAFALKGRMAERLTGRIIGRIHAT